MKYPGNCLVVALIAWAMAPNATRVRFVRNRHRRWRCIWERGGERFEFHAPGRAARPYWENILYLGEARKIA